METKETKGGCMMCEKGGMHGGMCAQHHWMHIIIRIAVAILIFWCGVQFGEVKSAVRNAYYGSSYGYGMMNSYGSNRGQNYYYGTPAMMGNYSSVPVPTTTTKAK